MGAGGPKTDREQQAGGRRICPTCNQPLPALHEQVLNLLAQQPPLSREEIARQAGCHRQTVTKIAALYGQGRGRGRPAKPATD